MKKLLTVITVLVLALALILSLTSRGKSVKLLENASPETSAMAFYRFDGENTTVKWLYDKDEENKIISRINALGLTPAKCSDIADMAIPCYGIEICDTEGYEIWLSYSNGLWLTKDGSVYRGSFDFRSLYEGLRSGDADITKSGARMPNSGILGEYDVRYYEEPENMTDEKDGVLLTFKSLDGSIATVTLTNGSDTDFLYGEYFSLQKELDGRWYTLPPKLSNYGFTDIGLILKAHDSRDERCDLTMYGELSAGRYRIEKEGLAAEFEIK